MAQDSNPFAPSSDPSQADQPPGSGLAMTPLAGAQSASLTPQLGAMHAQAKAQFQATSKAMGQYDLLRKEFSKLGSMGDMVTIEDVIDSAGRLVAAGLDPKKLAAIMSDMPQGGQALSGWLGQRAAAAAINEAKLMPQHEAARHQLGLASLQLLASHHLDDRPQSQPASASQIPLAAAQPQGNA